MSKQTRREFLEEIKNLGFAGAIGIPMLGAKNAVRGGMSEIVFPERLNFVNQCADRRFLMRLKNEVPVELSPVLEGTNRLSHFISHVVCEHRGEAVALCGIDVDANGYAEGTELGIMIDGECIWKNVLEKASTFVDSFLASTDIFLAETPTGSIAGIFMPNGTRVEVFFTVPGISRPIKLRTATYKIDDSQKT